MPVANREYNLVLICAWYLAVALFAVSLIGAGAMSQKEVNCYFPVLELLDCNWRELL